ncbi:MAG: DeoR/GlpR family DNA-binding transcription regulator [Betaproteobacteria bacterium]
MTAPTDDAAAPARQDALLIEERRNLIKDLVRQQRRATVAELAERFGTSLVTIRGDLNALALEGALIRTRGGALPLRDEEEVPIDVKGTLHQKQKQRIAVEAARLIRDGETVLLDSGTTTYAIACQIRELPFKGINVITNALNIAAVLASVPHVNLIMPGGQLREQSFSLSGPIAVNSLQGLHADRLFLGVDSLDPEIGLMTPHLQEAQLNAQMIRISRQVIAVADSSKLLRRNLSVIASVDQLHILITDTGANPETVEGLRRRGVEVILA